jgi:exodeoxyribonuclease VII large subunit
MQYVTPSANGRAFLTPSQLNALARDMLEGAFPLIWVQGELSGVSRPASGHLYFTLKDARAQVRCALFKPKSQLLRFRPLDGAQVMLRARLTVYEARGDYQLIVEHMEEAGEGALLRAFEELKARLAAEGLFDAARKRPLPRLLQRIAIITSPSGAAVRDVLSVLRRRFPLLQADVLPVPVQGSGAAALIADMLARADRAGRYDALLLTRGGGSLDDLQAFNDESLARAIVASRTPVISAIGHEVDFSIADFVADLRAPTPSAAAELITPDIVELQAQLARRRSQVERSLQRSLETRAQRVDGLQRRLALQRPEARLARNRSRLLETTLRLHAAQHSALLRRRERSAVLAARLLSTHPQRRLATLSVALRALRARREAGIARSLERNRARLALLVRALHAVSPLATIARGYAIVLDEDSGRLLRRAADASAGQALRIRWSDGELTARVTTPGRREPD